MIKKLFVCFFLTFMLFEQYSLANHLMGGSLTYKDKGFVNGGKQKRYTFTLKLYRDCNGGGSVLPGSADIGIYIQDPLNPNDPDKSQYQPFQSFSLSLQGTITQIPPLTPTANCTYTPNNVCIEEGVYENTFDIDTSSAGYHIIYENYARNVSISNLQVNPPVGMAFYAIIPTTQETNSTPAFSSAPVSFFCANTTISFYNTAIDPDGDSLVYQLVQPYRGYATAVNPPPNDPYSFPIPLNTYNGGYSFTDVFGPFGVSTINPNTGIASFTCTQLGFYVVVVEVSEYRAGKLLSKIRRDLQIIVDGNCPVNPNPRLDNTINPLVNDTMYIDEGDNVCFPLNYADPNGDSLFVTYSGDLLDINLVNPGPTISGPLKGQGFISNTLCWQTVCGQGRSAPYTFRVTLQDNGCPSFPIPLDLYVFVRKPVPVITGPSYACTMENNVAYNITGQPGSTYTWVVAGGTPPNGTGSNLNLNWGAPGFATIKTVETNRFNCKSDSTAYSVTIRNLPVGTITGPSEICFGESASLDAPVGYTYTWSGGINSNARTIIVNPTSTTTYTLAMTDGYCSSIPVSHVLTVNPLPAISITKTSDNNCPEVSNVTLTGNGGTSYVWSTGTSSSGITVTPSVTTTYAVTGTDSKGCTNTSMITVNVLPPCRVSLTSAPNDTVCLGGSTVLSDITGMATSFKWYEEAFPATLKGTSGTYTYTASPMPSANPWGIIMEGTDNNGCVGKDTFKVFIRDLPVILTSKSTDSICPGDSVKLTGSGGRRYYWRNLNNPGTTLNANPLDSSVWVTPTITSYYVLEGEDSWPCSNFDTIKVNVRLSPPVSISTANDSICIGSSTILTGLGAKDYFWSISTSPSTVISTAKNLFVNPLSSTTYLLMAVDKYGCKNRDTIALTVLNLPNIQATASPAAYCPGDSSTIRSSGGATYMWVNYTMPGVVINTDSIFTISPTYSTSYIVTGTDRYGCVNKDTLAVLVKNKPPKRRILGTPYACPSLSGVLYKVTDTVPSWPVSASTFIWTLVNASPSSGQALNRDSLKVDFPASPGFATIIVIETNGENCLGDTMRHTVDIKEIFTPPKPKGEDTLCSRDTVGQVYTTPYNTIGSVYKWHVKGGRIISGDGTNSVVVNWDTLGVRSGRIWFEELSSTATANCYGLSDTLFVTIYQTPLTGGIIGKNSVCINSRDQIYYVSSIGGSTYQWLVQNAVIQEGNGTFAVKITWNTVGTYTLKVLETSANGCPGDTIYLNVTVNALPVVDSIMGAPVVCPSNFSQQLYYIRTPHPGSKYLWSIQNGTILSGGDNDSVYVRWNIDFSKPVAGLFNISVIEISADSCIGSAYITKSVKVDGSIPVMQYVTCPPLRNELEIKWPVSYKGGELNTYSLYRRLYNHSADTMWKYLGSLSTNLYTDKNVSTSYLSYEYKYVTRDLCGDSSVSVPHNSILLGAADDKANDRILLTWNAYNNWTEGLRTYEIWRKLEGEQEFTFYQSTDTVTSYVVNEPKESFRHCYRIKAIENGGGNTSWSNDTCIVYDHRISIPSAFSPNGDGKNDFWVIQNIEAYKDVSIEIFNRWGENIFKVNGYNNTWDGTINGKELPGATYFYVIKLKRLVEGQKETYTGNVTIMR